MGRSISLANAGRHPSSTGALTGWGSASGQSEVWLPTAASQPLSRLDLLLAARPASHRSSCFSPLVLLLAACSSRHQSCLSLGPASMLPVMAQYFCGCPVRVYLAHALFTIMNGVQIASSSHAPRTSRNEHEQRLGLDDTPRDEPLPP